MTPDIDKLRELARKALNDYAYVTPPHLRDYGVMVDRILALPELLDMAKDAGRLAGREAALEMEIARADRNAAALTERDALLREIYEADSMRRFLRPEYAERIRRTLERKS